MIKTFKYLMLASAAFTLALSCSSKEDNPTIEKPGETNPEAKQSNYLNDLTESNINGTTINPETIVAGLITDTSTGKGIKGVPVTDGYTYTSTDENGVYQLVTNTLARKVWYTTPSAYKISLDKANHQPYFYSSGKLVNGRKYRVDFSLTPLESPENNFTLAMVGDPQCCKTTESARYSNETIADMKATFSSLAYPNVYAITLGDITYDSSGMWNTMHATMSNVVAGSGYIPFFQCIGNHDHDSLSSDTDDNAQDDYNAVQKFFDTFGPTDYSFDRGNAHIIVMDDIMVKAHSTSGKPNGATWSYNGGLTDNQMNWLKEDVSFVKDKANTLVFICMHIPVRGGSASGGSNVNTNAHYTDLLNLLKQFKEAHIMIGHTHYPQNYIHSSYVCTGGKPIYEHIHGAACGAWWSCNSNVTGEPNGYSIYTIEGSSVKNWVAKPATANTKLVAKGNPASYQMRVYDGNQVYTGTKGYQYAWYNASNVGGSANIVAKGNAVFKGCFVAEVWNDDDTNWKLEFWQNGGKVGDFKRIANGGSANIAITSYYFNQLGKNTTSWASATASHYWYYKPASATPLNEQNWEVKAYQTIPSSGVVNTYTCSALTTDYTEF